MAGKTERVCGEVTPTMCSQQQQQQQQSRAEQQLELEAES